VFGKLGMVRLVCFNVLFNTLQIISGTIFAANHLTGAQTRFRSNQTTTKSNYNQVTTQTSSAEMKHIHRKLNLIKQVCPK